MKTDKPIDRSDALIEGAWRAYEIQATLPYRSTLGKMKTPEVDAWEFLERVRARLQFWYRIEAQIEGGC